MLHEFLRGFAWPKSIFLNLGESNASDARDPGRLPAIAPLELAPGGCDPKLDLLSLMLVRGLAVGDGTIPFDGFICASGSESAGTLIIITDGNTLISFFPPWSIVINAALFLHSGV